MSCYFLLHGILLTQGLNSHRLHLLHCRQILYHCATSYSPITHTDWAILFASALWGLHDSFYPHSNSVRLIPFSPYCLDCKSWDLLEKSNDLSHIQKLGSKTHWDLNSNCDSKPLSLDHCADSAFLNPAFLHLQDKGMIKQAVDFPQGCSKDERHSQKWQHFRSLKGYTNRTRFYSSQHAFSNTNYKARRKLLLRTFWIQKRNNSNNKRLWKSICENVWLRRWEQRKNPFRTCPRPSERHNCHLHCWNFSQ